MSTTEIWRQYEADFPVRRELIYLNHAAVAPLCRPASEAMKWLAEDNCRFGSLHYDQWQAAYEGLRVATGQLLNAGRDEIAITKNTSEGIATVALGFPWSSGDRIVLFQEEFPANQYIWRKLAERFGLMIEWLSALDPLEKIDAACRGARLLAISFVQYLGGYRIDVEAIGEICRRHGVFFFLDAIQGMGAFPLDVKKAGVHAAAADGHKWLLGPEGCGVLFIDREWQDRIEPVELGWTNVENYADYASRDMTLRKDAGRYECGTLNTVGCFGLRASIEFLLKVGIDAIARQVQGLGDLLAEGAAAKGYEILTPRTAQHGAGIISIRKPGVDSRAVHAKLREQGIIGAPRQGWLRLSPHFYVSGEDIRTAIAALL